MLAMHLRETCGVADRQAASTWAQVSVPRKHWMLSRSAIHFPAHFSLRQRRVRAGRGIVAVWSLHRQAGVTAKGRLWSPRFRCTSSWGVCLCCFSQKARALARALDREREGESPPEGTVLFLFPLGFEAGVGTHPACSSSSQAGIRTMGGQVIQRSLNIGHKNNPNKHLF